MLARIEEEEKNVGLNEQDQIKKDKIKKELKRLLNYEKISNLQLMLARIEEEEKNVGLNEQYQIKKDKIKKELKKLLAKGNRKKINEQDQIMEEELKNILSKNKKQLLGKKFKNFEDVKKCYREYEQTIKSYSEIESDIIKELKIKKDLITKNNRRIKKFIILLYVHKIIINDKNDTVRKDTCNKLNEFKKRLFSKCDYKFNEKIRITFEVIEKTIDCWYKTDKVGFNNVEGFQPLEH